MTTKIPCRACGDSMVPHEIYRLGSVVRFIWFMATGSVGVAVFGLWFTSEHPDAVNRSPVVGYALWSALVVALGILTFVLSQREVWACPQCGHWIDRTSDRPPSGVKPEAGSSDIAADGWR